MVSTGSSLALLVAALVLLPAPGAGQFVMRDDVNGWAWLSMLTDRNAIVQLVHASPGSGVQQQLDAELLQELQSRGLRRALPSTEFDPAVSQVLVECSAVDWSAQGTDQIHFGLHAEVSYWDHTRLAATEIYESVLLGSINRDAFTTGAYVQACTRSVSPVLQQLGYDRG